MRYLRQTKLQQLCLTVIAENIKYYVKNDIPQEHIYFLHQFYSDEIFKRISYNHIRSRDISEETMLWFLNPYSKVIFLSRVSETIIERFKEMGSTISYLNLRKSDATESMINSILCCVPNVTELNLESTLCSDKAMLLIQRRCPKILNLNLKSCQKLTDQGMTNLCGSNRCLEVLNLKLTSITPAGVSAILNGFPSLKILKKEGFAEIFFQINEMYLKQNIDQTCHYNLTELIYDFGYTYKRLSVILLWIILCPNIEKVWLKFEVNYFEIALCSKFKKLKHLDFATNPEEATSGSKLLNDPLVVTMFPGIVPQDGGQVFNILDPFMNMPDSNRLTTLRLSYTQIPTNTFFKCLEHLKILELYEVTFSDFDEKYVKQRQNNIDVLRLENVDLAKVTSRKAVLKLLSVSRNVTEFNLNQRTEVPPEVFDTVLNSMQKLSSANFSSTTLDKPTVLKFFKLPSLTSLYLNDCSIYMPFDSGDLRGADFQNFVIWGETNMPLLPMFEGVVSFSTKSLSWVYKGMFQ